MGQSPASSRGGGGVTVLSYVEFTSPVTVSAVSAAAANTIVTAASVAADGATLLTVEFYAPGITSASSAFISLWRDTTDLGLIAAVSSATGGSTIWPVRVARLITPTAGSYVFTVRGYRGANNATVNAGSGGSDTYLPGYIRVTSGA